MQDREYYFDILGLRPGAPPEEIASAHKNLMEYWNPDRVPDFYRQKAMEGRDKIEEAYQALMGLKKTDQHETKKPSQTTQGEMKAQQTAMHEERILLGKDRDEALFYLDKKTIIMTKDKAEVEVEIYLPEESARFSTAQGCVRRAGYKSLECLVEKWGFGLSNNVFIKHGLYYKSKCGQLVQATGDLRKVWKPISSGSVEEKAWKVVDGIFHAVK
ncbi:MAG: J domain-containing protein [Syntrophorhabdus sp.]